MKIIVELLTFLSQRIEVRNFIALLLLFQTLFASIDEIVITHNTNNPPFKFVNEQGNPDGILIDIWRLWSQKTGIKVKFLPATFEDSLTHIQNGSADVNAGIFHTLEREKEFLFSKPLMPLKYYYFFHHSIPATFNSQELESYVIATPKGFTTSFVKDNFPKLTVKEFNDFPDIYEDFIVNKSKVMVSPIENFKYFLSYYDLENNAYVDVNRPLFVKEYLGAVKIGNEGLLEVINQGLAHITQEEIEEIKNAWFDKFNTKLKAEELVLTQEEKKWLEQHKTIRVGVDASWQPFDYVGEEGEHLGIASDYIKYLEKKLGINVEIVSGVWNDVLDKAKNKEVDLLACIANTSKRRDFLLFSSAYLNIKTVIITQNANNSIFNIQHLFGKKVAIAKGNFVQDLLETNYPNIELLLTHSNEEALKAVAVGDADAHIGNIATATYFIEKNMLTNLKIASSLENYNYMLSIAVRNDWEIFRNIVQKTLNTMTKEQKDEIYKKWIKFDKPIMDYSLVWKITALFVVLILFTLFWIKRQKRIIMQKEAHQHELEKLQNELKIALQKAQDATKAKSDFLSNMSHEIRTPMNSILGFTEILSHEITNNVHKDYLNSIKTSSKTLLGIINDILDLSKIEAGKLKLNCTAIDINHIIKEMQVIFRDKLKEKNLKLIFELDSKIPDYVLMDELRFRQILLNLLSNAIKFTNEGSITIKTEVNFLEETCSTFDLIVSVIDTGIGIEEKYLNKIFDYFEQINNTNHLDSSKGSGLGLAICTKIVNLFGGKIYVESQIGVGSCFKIVLNNIHVSSAKEAQHSNFLNIQEYIFEKSKILIVDDIADNRKLISLFFSKTNIETFEACNGLEALEFLAQHRVDLVLLDIKMPVLDGYETIVKIKSELDYTMPVVALTASVMGEDSYKIRQYKFDGYLRKPVSQEELFFEMAKFLPHTKAKTMVQENKTEIHASHSMKENKKTVKHILEAFANQCNTIKDKGDFSLIEAFTKELQLFANEFNHNYLEQYCTILLENIESFEISKVKKQLNDFDEIVKQLNKELEDV
jgi:signal transduction histidine kinase/DNA-binding response OmpR family regulator